MTTISIRTSKKHVRITRTTFNLNQHTVRDVKQAYCDEHDNTVTPDKLIFRAKTRNSRQSIELTPDNATLASLGIQGRIAVFSLSYRLYNKPSKHFCVNIRGKQGKHLTLKRLFTANDLISDIVVAYKDEECIEQHYKLEEITLLSRGQVLQHNKKLHYYDILNENNLINVTFKTKSKCIASDNETFTLMIQAISGKLYKIKDVSSSTTISTIKSRFMEELDEYKGELEQIELKKSGKNMPGKMTLGEFGIVNGIHMPLIAAFKIKAKGKMVHLKDMKNQADLIKWIESLPEDTSFITATFKSEIIAGIKEFEKNESVELTGWDFFDADDADDIMELCGVKKPKAKKILRIIAAKKQQDYGSSSPSSVGDKTFTLMIQGIRRKYYKIKDVSASTKISTVKSRFMEQLGDQAAADEYKGKLSQWNKSKGKIELKKNGKNMPYAGKMTLGEYGIVNGMHMPLIVAFKVLE